MNPAGRVSKIVIPLCVAVLFLLFWDGAVRLSETHCYKSGCFADVTFRDEPSLAQHHERLGEAVKEHWNDAVFLSGPEHRADGSIGCSLVLLSSAR